MSIPITFTTNLRRVLQKTRVEGRKRAGRIAQLEDEKRRLQDRVDRLERTLDSFGQAGVVRNYVANAVEIRVVVDRNEAMRCPMILERAVAQLQWKLQSELGHRG